MASADENHRLPWYKAKAYVVAWQGRQAQNITQSKTPFARRTSRRKSGLSTFMGEVPKPITRSIRGARISLSRHVVAWSRALRLKAMGLSGNETA